MFSNFNLKLDEPINDKYNEVSFNLVSNAKLWYILTSYQEKSNTSILIYNGSFLP